MDIGGQAMLTQDLEASVTGLPSTYDVFVGWNPNSNSDVGWLTLKKGVTRDFKHLQLRDFNLNNLENINELSEKEKVTDSSEGYSPAACLMDKISRDREDSKLMSVLNLKVQEEDVPSSVEKITSHDKTFVEKSEVMKSEKVSPRVRMGKGIAATACVYCNRNVKDKERHEAKCPSKNAKNTERVKCSICGYRILRRGLSTHMKTHSYVTKNQEMICPVCKKSFGSMLSLSKHTQLLHPNLPYHNEPIVKKYSESADVEQNRSVEKKNGIILSETVDSGIGQKVSSEDLLRGELSEHDFTVKSEKFVGDVQLQPAWDEDEQASCRIKFEMEVAGVVNKKTIKTLMSERVEKSMRKFTKHVGHKFDDLEFKSHDIILSGEELAGSIDKGLIKVSLISFDDKEGYDLEVLNDLTPASNFEDLRKDYFEEMRCGWFKTPPLFHHSTPAQSDTWSNSQEINEDFPMLDSVSAVSVGFSEGATDTEDNMDIDGEVVGNTEHVVDFSMF